MPLALALLLAAGSPPMAKSYVLRLKYRPSQVMVDHSHEHTVWAALTPIKISKVQDDDYDAITRVIKVLPNGDALMLNKKKGGRKPSPEASKHVYQVLTARNHISSEGSSPSSLRPQKFGDPIPSFPAGPVTVGSSWQGRINFDQFGGLQQTCRVTKIAQKGGSLCAWLAFEGDSSLPESSNDLKPTSLSVRGRAIFDIDRGRFLQVGILLRGVMKGPQTLRNGSTVHTELVAQVSESSKLVR
ncbi:MAG TPA: hypothetical protein VG944_16610 [Fimbriimonas sp.]|nr:hypothetical protein [Fimbriimonas sp.]